MSQREGETDIEYKKRKRKNTKIVFKGLMEGMGKIIEAGETGKKLKTLDEVMKDKPEEPEI